MSVLNVILGLMGGLGLFLYGMKLMSDGLEKAAGAKMRGVLEFFTKNRFVGMLVGVIFTAVIQSSSATTVMVVSFVNSGLMDLMQAAGVIMGANIGTTVTSQLISFNLSEWAPLFVMVGVVMSLFSKRQKVVQAGEIILGFGILFMGLSTMSDSMSVLKESPVITQALSSLENHYLAILLGFLITAVLQSSSATVGIVLLLASQGLLEIQICFFIILGCNIGSCVSALLASLGGKKDAKRAAWIHFLFNIIGSLVILVILTVALEPVTGFIQRISGYNLAREVANAHTIIKVVEVVILFPFIQWIVKLTYRIVPGVDKQSQGQEGIGLEYIGGIFSPTTAVFDATRELERMGGLAVGNLGRAMDALLDMDGQKLQEVYEVERNIDYLNEAITNYLVDLNQATIPVDDARSIGGLLHVASDIERIGDHAENVADAAATRRDQGLELSSQARAGLSRMLDLVIRITNAALDMFSNNDSERMQEILNMEDQVDEMEKRLQQEHVERLTRNECTPAAGMLYSDIISGLERVADHATNIASFIAEEPEG